MGQSFGHGLLARHVDVLPFSGDRPMCMRDHGSGGAGGSAMEMKVGNANPQGRTVAVSGQVHEAA